MSVQSALPLNLPQFLYISYQVYANIILIKDLFKTTVSQFNQVDHLGLDFKNWHFKAYKILESRASFLFKHRSSLLNSFEVAFRWLYRTMGLSCLFKREWYLFPHETKHKSNSV